jgi:selenide,water dikinase
MCQASKLDADLFHDAIPIYPGARALSDAGVSSTLMPANYLDSPVAGLYDELLYDPQTAGGLLAAVPEKLSTTVLQAIIAQGFSGHIIGRLRKGTGCLYLT